MENSRGQSMSSDLSALAPREVKLARPLEEKDKRVASKGQRGRGTGNTVKLSNK